MWMEISFSGPSDFVRTLRHCRGRLQSAPLRAVSEHHRPGGRLGGPRGADGQRVTYGFRLVRRLDLLAFEFLPIDVPEERMLFDISFALGAAAQAFAGVFGHQLGGWGGEGERERNVVSNELQKQPRETCSNDSSSELGTKVP